MTKTTFADAPKSIRAGALGDTLRMLTAPAEDMSGRIWPKGAKYQPRYGGNSGVVVEFVAGVVPLPEKNDEAGWAAFHAR